MSDANGPNHSLRGPDGPLAVSRMGRAGIIGALLLIFVGVAVVAPFLLREPAAAVAAEGSEVLSDEQFIRQRTRATAPSPRDAIALFHTRSIPFDSSIAANASFEALAVFERRVMERAKTWFKSEAGQNVRLLRVESRWDTGGASTFKLTVTLHYRILDS